MPDPRLPARNTAILTVACLAVLAFIAWTCVVRLRRSGKPSEMEWWIAGFWLVAFDATLLLTMVLR